MIGSVAAMDASTSYSNTDSQNKMSLIGPQNPKNAFKTMPCSKRISMYDVCIVGAGMIGSATAKHLSEISRTGKKICLIGPSEPKNRYNATERDIFGSYYDEGRIARATDSNPVWAKLAKRSIAAYKKLEQQSGIQFFSEAGYVVIAKNDSTCIKETIAASKSCHAEFEVLDSKGSKKQFPFLNITDDDQCIFEKESSGHVSPRKLVQALRLVAKQNGCDIIDEVVDDIREITDNNAERFSEITLSSGQKLFSHKVLLATGAFTTFRNLLPKHVEPDVNLKSATVLRVEIDDHDAASLRNMPSIYFNQEESQCLPHNVLRRMYILPPIRYPDGKIYIKIGCSGSDLKITLTTAREMADWFRGQGYPGAKVPLLTTLQHVVKGFTPRSTTLDTCVTTTTPTSRLYIDMLSPTLGVALGGNGWAAKSCIEIGKIAALMVTSDSGHWTYDIPRENFLFTPKTISKL
ncbi:unnamed protein product [Owenia fusiformis]|uniref:FAD dependent oxidoreductase domain-containing protein n=1 Tax=Owenia fusiformis TaxID=6347 RepID=A0A8J1XTM3_OWEFU|nr:unnamed protein product [Owenia fusiformis]